MSLLERIYFLHSRIQAAVFPNATDLAEEFEVSPATAHRDINYLRDRLLAPLAFDQQKNGYYYTEANFHLPFEESSKIILFLGILTTIAAETGLAGLPELHQLQDKLTGLAAPGKKQLAQHLHCEWVETEPIDETIFMVVVGALLSQQQLQFNYTSSTRGAVNRIVDPLKLLHYQGRWYLYGWCRLREDRRLFHLVRVRAAKELNAPADHRMAEEDASLTGVFGIFKGAPKHEVTIRFKGFAAETVRFQSWHPDQQLEEEAKGILLTLPVADDREIIMKVLQFGSQAEVISPLSLRKKIAGEIKAITQLYDTNSNE